MYSHLAAYKYIQNEDNKGRNQCRYNTLFFLGGIVIMFLSSHLILDIFYVADPKIVRPTDPNSFHVIIYVLRERDLSDRKIIHRVSSCLSIENMNFGKLYLTYIIYTYGHLYTHIHSQKHTQKQTGSQMHVFLFMQKQH